MLSSANNREGQLKPYRHRLDLSVCAEPRLRAWGQSKCHYGNNWWKEGFGRGGGAAETPTLKSPVEYKGRAFFVKSVQDAVSLPILWDPRNQDRLSNHLSKVCCLHIICMGFAVWG